MVRSLLEDDRVDVNVKQNDGSTALILASMHLTDASFCYQRQDAVVNKLLNHDGVEVQPFSG